MAEQKTTEQRIEGLIRVGLNSRCESLLNGCMMQDRHGQHYWLKSGALDTKVSDLPGQVVSQLESQMYSGGDDDNERINVSYLAEHLDGMFQIIGTRAPDFIRSLDNQGHSGVDIQQDLMSADKPYNANIPVGVVCEGKTAVMAYLAAHGFNNPHIGTALEVSRSTVRVNLSKFKN
jgi:hypothetical protein